MEVTTRHPLSQTGKIASNPLNPECHILKPHRPVSPAASCPLITGTAVRDYEKFFTDESKRVGQADAVAFPRSTEEVAETIRAAIDHDWPVTISGARTGIAAGAVPDGGLVISLERMNRLTGLRSLGGDRYAVSAEAGALLADLQRALREWIFTDSATWDADSLVLLDALRGQPFFFPPDPTETSASVGGMIACNASGAHTFRYGPTRPYVSAVTVVLANGDILSLKRGEHCFDANGRAVIQWPDGHETVLQAPGFTQPATKNAAGYYAGPNMDLVDLFIGSEGTLGMVTEADLQVVPPTETCSAAVLFFATESAALSFVERARQQRQELGLEALEYMDAGALRFLRDSRARNGAISGVPECLPPAADCAIYLDLGVTEAGLHDALAGIAALVAESGSEPDACWSAHDRAERERLRLFRHALPEAVNHHIATIRRHYPSLTKLGTDMAVPDDRLREIIHLYRSELDRANLDYVIFGHIGDNHLHVNILPTTTAQYDAGKALYLAFAEAVVKMGGSPAAEHGIGKLKTVFLELLVGRDGVAEMRALRNALDPDNRLGRGTLFE